MCKFETFSKLFLRKTIPKKISSEYLNIQISALKILILCTLLYTVNHLADVAHKFKVCIIEFLEDGLISALVRMAFESCLPECLLYHFLVRSKATLLPHAQDGAQLGKSCVRENLKILMTNI